MSYPVMAALPLSMAQGLHKAPCFNTVIQKPVAARTVSSASLQPYATWAFEFGLDNIQGNESAASSVLAQFFGIHMACNGRNGLFLFTDPQDNAVGAAAPMGTTGDGTSTQFQLARSIAGVAWDIVQNTTGALVIKVNGVTKTAGTDYSVSTTGVVTFVVAPTNGYSLTWQGSFQFLCRFDADTVDSLRKFTTNSGTDLWDISGVKFASEFV
jgi:uncharacterized protein (TIGR02217 family)